MTLQAVSQQDWCFSAEPTYGSFDSKDHMAYLQMTSPIPTLNRDQTGLFAQIPKLKLKDHFSQTMLVLGF